MIVESIVVLGIHGSQFAAEIRVRLLTKRISEEKVQSVVEVLSKVQELGVMALKLLMGTLWCCWEDIVASFWNLGFHFPIKELLEPYDVFTMYVDKHSPKFAIRYACIFPHGHILFCNIINEFGKRRKLASALTAYDASKDNLSDSNIYVHRTIIDVCGLCKDYMKSRYIYEDLLKQKVTSNIYVFNSLMNVNAHA